jgi:hypothetical protein
LKTLRLTQLNGTRQKLRDSLETIIEADNVALQSINKDAEMYYEKTGDIIRKDARGNTCIRSRPWKEFAERSPWTDFTEEVNGDRVILKIGKRIFQQILANYDAVIAERKESPKINEITKNTASIVKQAEKLKRTIIQTNEKLQKALLTNGRPDLKNSKVFINAKTEFDDLSYQHSNLLSQLAFYTNETENVPSFPSLTCTDTSAENSIPEKWRYNA